MSVDIKWNWLWFPLLQLDYMYFTSHHSYLCCVQISFPRDHFRNKFHYAPNFEEVDGAYWFWVVRACVHLSIRSSRTVHARVLKFHIWIPHGKIVDTHCFICPSYLPFWSYAPLKKSEWNLMHAISYEPCMLGFWNFKYGFLMEK